MNIAYYRKLKGMTQTDLAKAVDLNRTHISNLEAPGVRTSISLEKLFDIADVLNVPVMKFSDNHGFVFIKWYTCSRGTIIDRGHKKPEK